MASPDRVSRAMCLHHVQHMTCICRGRRNTLETSPSSFCMAGTALQTCGVTCTPHYTLYTPLRTPQCTLYFFHFTLHTSHFTLHIPHFTLYTHSLRCQGAMQRGVKPYVTKAPSAEAAPWGMSRMWAAEQPGFEMISTHFFRANVWFSMVFTRKKCVVFNGFQWFSPENTGFLFTKVAFRGALSET